MGEEHLDTIPEKESNEFIKSSVKNLVLNPSEYEDLSNIGCECEVPVCDDFATFSNLLFDADEIFSSSDDKSFSDEDVPKEIYSSPLFDEEIISIKKDPHHFNVESDLKNKLEKSAFELVWANVVVNIVTPSLDEPLLLAPAADSVANVLAECNVIYDAYNEVACLILGSMTPELHRQFKNSSPYDMIKELKSMFEKQTRVERFDLIQTFHASKQKDEHPSKDDTCHRYKKEGHWKRNCHVYLAELLKKKKQAGSAGSSDGTPYSKHKPFDFQPLPAAPVVNAATNVLAEWNTIYDAYNKVTYLILDSMTPELHKQFKNSSPYDMIKELKSMFEKQARVERFDLIQTFLAYKQEVGKPVATYALHMKEYVNQLERLSYVLPLDLTIGLILNGLTKDFSRFERNYNMHNTRKTIGELHAMLIEYEKAKGKGKANGKGNGKQVYIPKPKNPKPSAKEQLVKDDTCHHYKEEGDWKRNYLVYLAELLKKKKHVSGQVDSSFITFKDDYSYYGYVYLLKHKHEVFETFMVFKNEVENQLGKTIKVLRSDRESVTRILNMVPSKKVDKTPYELWYGKVPNLSYLKEIMGYYFYFLPKNKIVVTRYAEFLEKNLITQEVSGRAVDLEEIQDKDTMPFEITSEIPMVVEGFEPPQEELILIHRPDRTHQALNHLCLNVEVEEHSLGDLNELTSYKVAMLDSESNKWIDVMNAEIQSKIDNMASGSNVTSHILYVDDIIIMGNHIPSLQSVKDYLGKCFAMNDLREAEFIFGIKIYKDRSKQLIGLVEWKSSKQGTIAMSATEAEYIVASKVMMEAVWIRKFILGLDERICRPTRTSRLCDAQDLTVGFILNGLTKDFARCVRNYNMHNIGKTVGELHAMLIEYEKGLPKKAETPQVMMIKGGKIQ
nr:hypothetical protein [Tanacetum cinerariifolium]